MAAPGAAFAGQPGRRPGYGHPAADRGNPSAAVGWHAARGLVGYAFNPQRRHRTPEPAIASTLAWLERTSLPVSQLSDPRVIRAALDGLCTRLDGSPAAANTVTRKRVVFHSALSHAVELGLLKHRPDGTIRVPIAPVLVRILHRHLRHHATTPDGRLFRGTRGGMLGESVYGRTWHAAWHASQEVTPRRTPFGTARNRLRLMADSTQIR